MNRAPRMYANPQTQNLSYFRQLKLYRYPRQGIHTPLVSGNTYMRFWSILFQATLWLPQLRWQGPEAKVGLSLSKLATKAEHLSPRLPPSNLLSCCWLPGILASGAENFQVALSTDMVWILTLKAPVTSRQPARPAWESTFSSLQDIVTCS